MFPTLLVNTMAEFTVTWSIEVSAENSHAAAEEARKIQLDPNSEAIYFEVYPMGNSGVVDAVDLLLDTEIVMEGA